MRLEKNGRGMIPVCGPASSRMLYSVPTFCHLLDIDHWGKSSQSQNRQIKNVKLSDVSTQIRSNGDDDVAFHKQCSSDLRLGYEEHDRFYLICVNCYFDVSGMRRTEMRN